MTELITEINLTPQQRKVLQHIRKTGNITEREAFVEYSMVGLRARIAELRAKGFNVVHTLKKHPVTGQRYGSYSLARA
jgi:hypothetical protein